MHLHKAFNAGSVWLPPTSTADPDHPLAAGAWSPPTRARKTASLAYRLQAGAGISGRTKHPRHSGGGALAGLAHYMLGWPGGGSRCADAPVYLLHSRTLPSPSQRLPLSWPKVFQGCVRYDDTTIRLCSSIQTHLYYTRRVCALFLRSFNAGTLLLHKD